MHSSLTAFVQAFHHLPGEYILHEDVNGNEIKRVDVHQRFARGRWR